MRIRRNNNTPKDVEQVAEDKRAAELAVEIADLAHELTLRTYELRKELGINTDKDDADDRVERGQ